MQRSKPNLVFINKSLAFNISGGIGTELINARYKRIYFSETLFFWLRICLVARVEFFRVWILINLKRILIEGISKIILDFLEWMPFCNQYPHFFIFIQRISLLDEEWMRWWSCGKSKVVPEINYTRCRHQWHNISPRISGPQFDIWAWFFPSGAYHWRWSHRWLSKWRLIGRWRSPNTAWPFGA